MPDRRRHRGPHPKDPELFAPRHWPTLRRAVADLSWLLGRGYSEKAALKLVGDRYRSGDAELTLACDDRPAEFRETLAGTYLPRRVVAQRPATADGLDQWLDALELDAAPPIWADRDARDGPTAYACRSFACSPPAATLADAIEFFG
jgi:uncharacterized protein YyaL (SSP411 family)